MTRTPFAQRWGVGAALVGLLAVTALVYRPSLDGPFVFDDVEHVARNPLIRDLRWFREPWRAAEAGAPPDATAAFRTRYLAELTFALDYRWQGPGPRGFRRTNLAIHLLATCLVWGLVRRLVALPQFARSRLAGRADAVALLAAALFALHPLQTQAVSYVVQRMASLAACLGLLAALGYLRARTAAGPAARLGWSLASLVALLAALLSKQNAATFPLLVALIELAFLGAIPGRRRLLVPVALLSLVLPALVVWRASSSERPMVDLIRSLRAAGGGTPVLHADYLRAQPGVVMAYLRLFCWPAGQSIDHAVAVPRRIVEPRVLGALAALAGLAGLAVRLWRRGGGPEPGWRLVGFGILWFFVALSIEAGAVPIQDLMAEHRLYMPIVGLAIATVAAAASLRPAPARRTAVAALAVALVPLAAATRARNEIWSDDLLLWRDAERQSPRSPRVLFNVGEILIERGDLAGGEAYLRRALAADPAFAPALANLGAVAASRGDLIEARRLLERALDADPGNWIAAVNLGDLARWRRDLDAARRYYETAIRAASWEPIPRRKLAELEALERRANPLARP